MSQVIIEDDAGIYTIVEHTVPVPEYDIGTMVGWPDARDVTGKTCIEGVVTGYTVDVSLLKDEVREQIVYSIDDGTHTVEESEIDYYYPESEE